MRSSSTADWNCKSNRSTDDDDALDLWAGECLRANPHSLRIPEDGNAEEGGREGQ